ncbi:xylulokinase [Tsukamurella sp. 8F]|uniref:xylulokinase n=1 Tax=unclassified Tsukamurella TaxID=2633480 RepID=UPI0023B90E78|nr:MULTISPECIES: xylulokinase [unclassified Tsukamurella]MDF0528691.1 xylulokinase [Tsukamurella sp. 8J]MDF0585653.1 xylulokinase [Tsukamurella sp. 8F]
MPLVAGIDSSSQSCKVVVCDAATGAVVRSGAAPHPPGTEVDPESWWDALQVAVSAAGGVGDVAALAVGGQQHGMVCLDDAGAVVRDALLWNDVRSADAAADLVSDLGGPDMWADAVGVVPVAAITAAKLRWLADHEPAHADRTAAVCLPHDWLTWRLSGAAELGTLATDRSDASGTGYFSAAADEYRTDLLELALRGRRPELPRVLGPAAVAGATPDGAALGPGAGDNAAAALGLGARPGDAIVSIGTSGVVSAVATGAPNDPSGIVAGFADATGHHLPLVCTLNGAPVLAATARALGVDLGTFADMAISAPAGAGGLAYVPYLGGERSPNLPGASGALHGMTGTNLTPANIARAAVEGLLCSLAYCLDAIEAQGTSVQRIVLVGGGSRSAAVRAIAPAVFGREVTTPLPGEYVALGAARQAAWVLEDVAPDWSAARFETFTAAPTPDVRKRYREAEPLTLGR